MDKKGYILIQDWMLDLPLSITETVLYAIIYGFSQDSESCFRGSLAYLARKGKVSKDTIRRALNKLTDGGYIQKIERIVNGVTFHDYRTMQGGIANCNPSPCKLQPHNNIDNKRINNISNNKGKFDFYAELIALGVTEQTAKDWMEVRKQKKAANTETAFRKIQHEIAKSGMSAEACIRMSAENSWQGFKADWVKAWVKNGAKNYSSAEFETPFQRTQRLMREAMGLDINDMGGQIDEQ